jgi:hypothetical protein
VDRGDGHAVRDAAVGGSSVLRTLFRPAAPSAMLVALAFLALLALAVALQVAAGAYANDFTDDDASHYVTGLFFHDYVLALLARGWVSPMPYLRDYHSHYPLIGVGHWGPLYYLVEAGWMLVVGTSRAAVLVLSAVVTAATATLLFALVGRHVGRVQGGLAAAMLVASPIVDDATAALMLDMPIAGLSLAAGAAYVAYLGTGRAGWGVWFGLIASAALLVKGNAMALALVPPLAVLLGRRFELLRQPGFWAPAAVVAVLAGPWTWFTYTLVAQGWRHPWGWPYTSIAAPANFGYLVQGLGWPVVALAVLGLVAVIATRRPGPAETGMAALFLGFVLFQASVPAELQERYIAPALPPALFLAWHGLRQGLLWLDRRTGGALRPGGSAGPMQATAAVLLAVGMAATVVKLPPRPHEGLIDAARAIWQQDMRGNPSVLLALDGNPEGNMVAELALGDPARPSLFAVRGSRLLGGGGYNNRDYAPRFATAAEAGREIDRYAIQFVVHQASPPQQKRPPWTHIAQVAELSEADPARWQVVFRGGPPERPVTVWRIADHAEQKLAREALLALSAPRTLGD